MRRTAIGAFAIDTNGRGDEHFLDVVLVVDEDVEEQCRAARVDVHVAIDLIHALADADRGAEVHDRIGLEHQRLEHRAIANVAADVGRLRVGIRRPRAGAMNLRLEVVEHLHAVLARNQRINEMGSDVTGAAGHEDLTNTHVCKCPVRENGAFGAQRIPNAEQRRNGRQRTRRQKPPLLR